MTESGLATLVLVARGAGVLAFVALVVAATMRGRLADRAGRWLAPAFGAITIVLALGWVSDIGGFELPTWASPLLLVPIVLFPYLLLRFTATFRPLPTWFEVIALGATVLLLASLLAQPSLLDDGWYLGLALGYWVTLSLVTIVLLWRAGRHQPSVARRRMQLMASAAAVLIVALVSAVLPFDDPRLDLIVHTAVLSSGLVFGLGLAPPRALRLAWRRPEEERLRAGTAAVLRATDMAAVARELLAPTVAIVGGSAAAFFDRDGRLVAHHTGASAADDIDPEAPPSRQRPSLRLPLATDQGELRVWTSAYTPFFGREEVELLRSMAAVAALALERCELMEEERAQRMALDAARRDAEQAREQADRANTAKSSFLSRMSHELRTPLNAILGFGQLLELSTHLDEQDTEGVEQILKAGRHLLALIDDVLDLSRVEAGVLTISLEPVHAGELIADSLALVRPLATSRSIRVTTVDGACDVHVMTDRQRARQVLLNLLSNAVKYNYDGGQVDLWCSTPAAGTLRIHVRDSGPGINLARYDELFEPFQRLDAETSSVEGTGLGLALSRQLMERLGGHIGVASEPGEGATFWIDLPVTDGPPPDEEPLHQSTAPVGAGDHLLMLVEDNLANLRVVEAMLRQRPGVSVLPAMQGRLALELASQHPLDVIVLDLHLPDMPGNEVLHRLKANPSTRDIPVIVASADASPRRADQLREAGAFDYLTKPLDLQRFLGVIDAALEASRDREGRPGQPDQSRRGSS